MAESSVQGTEVRVLTEYHDNDYETAALPNTHS